MTIRKFILFINHSSPFLCHWLKLHSFSCISTCSRILWIKRAMSKVVLIAQALLEPFLHSKTQRLWVVSEGCTEKCFPLELSADNSLTVQKHCLVQMSSRVHLHSNCESIADHLSVLVALNNCPGNRETSEFTNLSSVYLCRIVLADNFYKVLYI